MRLALLAIKVGLVAVVTNFNLVPTAGTGAEPNYDTHAFLGAWSEKGLKLAVERRN